MKKENKIPRKSASEVSAKPETKTTNVKNLHTNTSSDNNVPSNNFLLSVAGKVTKFGGWSVDINTYISYWSDEVCDIHEVPRGYSPEVSEGINFYAPEYIETITKAFTDCAKSGIPYDLELQIITAKGNRVWVRTIGEAVKDAKGKIVQVQGAFKDISALKKSELALIESEEKYRALVESSQDAIFIDQDNKFAYINHACIKIFGAKCEEDLLGKSPVDFFPSERHEHILKRMKAIRSIGESFLYHEDKILRLDGKVIDVEINAVPLIYKGEEAFQVVMKDISIRKADEMKLKSSEERFRKSFNSHPGLVGISTLSDGKYIDVNDNFCKLLEYNRNEVIGFTSKDLGVFYDNTKRNELLNLLMKNGCINNFEVKCKTKSGKVRDGLFSAELIEMDGQECLLAQFEDITDFKKSIEELRQSEEKFSKVFHSNHYAIAIAELETGKFTDANESFERYTGYTKEEILGKTTVDLNLWVNPEDRDFVLKNFKEFGFVQCSELKLRIKSGEIRTWNLSIEIFDFENGKFTIGIFYDITESIRSKEIIASKLHLSNFSLGHSLDELLEETLNESERLTDSLIGFYHFIDDDQQNLTLQNWSARTKALFCKAEGKDSHYAIDKAGVWVDCVKTKKPVIHNDYMSLPHRKGMPKGHAEVIRELVVPVVRNGKIRAILGVGNKPYDYNEKDVETVSLLAEMAWDITEFKKKDEELKESEAKLREMVATKDKFFNIIAHDLRSPFNAIMGFSELLEQQMKEKNYEDIEEYSRFINSASRRAMNLLSNLLEWSRSQTGKIKFNPEYFDLSVLINEVAELFSDIAVQKSIVIKKDMKSNIPVIADKPMIENILRNLVSNAIKFSNFNSSIVVSVSQNENDTFVSVKDNGVGISLENMNNLFRLDINHTTLGTNKEKGTGLGLLLCKEFVEKHNGKLLIESKVGKGSTFSFNIPNK
jgi:PAS domain S-box-containing protein